MSCWREENVPGWPIMRLKSFNRIGGKQLEKSRSAGFGFFIVSSSRMVTCKYFPVSENRKSRKILFGLFQLCHSTFPAKNSRYLSVRQKFSALIYCLLNKSWHSPRLKTVKYLNVLVISQQTFNYLFEQNLPKASLKSA